MEVGLPTGLPRVILFLEASMCHTPLSHAIVAPFVAFSSLFLCYFLKIQAFLLIKVVDDASSHVHPIFHVSSG